MTAVTTEGIKFDDVTGMLAKQVQEGVAKIQAANEILLNDESGTGDRDIDKLFKDEKVEDKAAVDFWNKTEKARLQYRELLTKARNTYRVNVLDEEEKPESEVDKDAVKEIRKMVMASLNLMKDFANANGLKDVSAWADTVSIPQVGRQGSSGVSGAKKPRARVTFNDKTYESFGEAAKAVTAVLSTDDNKVEVGSSDLVQAWSDAGESETFEYNGISFRVTPKVSEKAA